MIYSVISMVICVILSGYFSATETAFSALNKTRLKALVESGNKKAKLTLKLSDNYDKLISTILIGNNIVNIAVASIGTLLFVKLYGEDLGPTLSTIVVTVVVLIFGEITPKSIAKDHPESFAMFSSPILRVIIVVFTPLNFIFTKWKQLVSKLFRTKGDTKMSQEELLIFLDEVHQEGAIDENGNKLLKNAVEFGNMEVQSILTPRMSLEGVEINDDKIEIAKTFERCGFSRLPVYDETMDNIVGIVHIMDFYKDGEITNKNLSEIMTAPLFVHKAEKIDNLLQILRNTKSHIAVVVDEFGGTMGIVTMEDILEELVGEIWDEHDIVDEPVEKISENEYKIDAGWNLDDFSKYFNIKAQSHSISVGGWVMDVMGRIPKESDSFKYENLKITVCTMDEHRISKILVKKENEEKE